MGSGTNYILLFSSWMLSGICTDACSIEVGIDYPGMNLNLQKFTQKYYSALACRALCSRNLNCKYFSWNRSTRECWLKKGISRKNQQPGTTSGPACRVSGQYYNLNKDGFVKCQTKEDCPPDFQTSPHDRVSYSCGGELYNRTWIRDICSENVVQDITCGNGKRVKNCGDCGTTEEECSRGRGGRGGCWTISNQYGQYDCVVKDHLISLGSLALYTSGIGGTGSSSATNPDRYDECGPQYCRRWNKCCLLVNIGWSNRYLGCPSYC